MMEVLPLDPDTLPAHLKMGWRPMEMMCCGWEDFYQTTEWVFTASNKMFRRKLFIQWQQLCQKHLGDGILSKGVRQWSWYFQGMGDAYDYCRYTWNHASTDWTFPFPVETRERSIVTRGKNLFDRACRFWFIEERIPNPNASFSCATCKQKTKTGILADSIAWGTGFYCNAKCLREEPFLKLDTTELTLWMKHYQPKNLMLPPVTDDYFTSFPNEGSSSRVEFKKYWCPECQQVLREVQGNRQNLDVFCPVCESQVLTLPVSRDPRCDRRIDGITTAKLATQFFLPRISGGFSFKG